MAGALPEPVLISTFLGLDEVTIGGQLIEFKHVFYSWFAIAVLVVVSLILRAKLTEKTPGSHRNDDTGICPDKATRCSLSLQGRD